MRTLPVYSSPVVFAMAVVHEEVHQGTGEKQQIRQYTQDMGGVFGEKEITCHRPDHHQADCVA
ncbi:hypothetical protein ACG10_10220 [Azotobacter chroococcum]|nr:hypothetical protein ACG10_10220 [Azotobacter chroococcum]